MTEMRLLGKKIRESELKKVPFMLIIGDEEIENKVFPIRTHGGGDLGKMKINDFIKYILKKSQETIKEF